MTVSFFSPKMSRRRSSSRQRATSADMIESIRSGNREIDSYRVTDLRGIAEELEVDVPARCKKAVIVELIRTEIFTDNDEDNENDEDDESNHETPATPEIIPDGAGVGVPIGSALPSVSENDNEGQDVQQDEQIQIPPPAASAPAPTLTPQTSTTDGRHPDDVAFEAQGGMVIPRKTYERCIEMARSTDVSIDNLEQNCLKFLYERALARTGTYDGDSEEERAVNAFSRLVGAAMGIPDYPPDADHYNTPPDPTKVMISTVVESSGTESSIRILKLRFPKYWDKFGFQLPPPFFARTEKLEFDADSDKVVDEVTRAIVASLNFTDIVALNKSFPVYKLRMDLMAAFYLVNKAGDVVLMNKDFLQKCPKPLELANAPSFYVCGMKPITNFTNRTTLADSQPLPHFQMVKKDAKCSYIVRLIFLIFLSYLMLDASASHLIISPYLPTINMTNKTMIDRMVRPINMTLRVLTHTANSLILPDLQYRACTLKTFYDSITWVFNMLGMNGFSWWFTLITMLFTETCMIWIRSRFCLISLGWLMYRRYIFVINPSKTTHGANPNPKIIETGRSVESLGIFSSVPMFRVFCRLCSALCCCRTSDGNGNENEENQEEKIGRFTKLKISISEYIRVLSRMWEDVKTRPFKESMYIWYSNVSQLVSNSWTFIHQDDWFGYRSSANKILNEAVDRNESVAQFVYEDQQVFRYFTYRWTPVNLSQSDDFKEWKRTLRAACGVPYDTTQSVTSMMSDLILSDDSKPGNNRVLSHNFLKTKGIGDDHPMENHPVYFVHPPGTRSKPASFRSHFLTVVPNIALICMSVWMFYESMPYINNLSSRYMNNAAVNSTAVNNAAVNSTVVNNTAAVNNTAMYTNNTAVNNTAVNSTAVNSTAVNNTAVYNTAAVNNTAMYNTAVTHQCAVYLIQKYDHIRWMGPSTWFRPFLSFLWTNTAFALVQLLQDDASKKWKRWYNGGNTGMYGTQSAAVPLTDLQVMQKIVNSHVFNMVAMINVLFFAMAHGDFHLKTGTILLGFVALYYNHLIPKIITKHYNPPAGRPNPQLSIVANQHVSNMRFNAAMYTLILPCVLILYRIVLLIGVGNIYHFTLSLCIGVPFGMFVNYLNIFFNNVPRPIGWINVDILNYYFYTIIFYLIVSLIACHYITKWNPEIQIQKVIFYIIFVFNLASFGVGNIVFGHANIQRPVNIILQDIATNVSAGLRNVLILTIVYWTLLVITTNSWNTMFGDVSGFNMSIVACVSIFFVFQYLIKNNLPVAGEM